MTICVLIAFNASGSCDMAAVSRFLYLLETARMPVKIESIQLGSRKSGQDDLTMQLRFSTIYEAKADPAGRRTRQGGPS